MKNREREEEKEEEEECGFAVINQPVSQGPGGVVRACAFVGPKEMGHI